MRGTTTAKGMNSVYDGRVAAGLAPKVVPNARLVTVPGIAKRVLLSPNEQIRQARIPFLCFPRAVFDPDVKPIERTSGSSKSQF
jgi:hypothetical protein